VEYRDCSTTAAATQIGPVRAPGRPAAMAAHLGTPRGQTRRHQDPARECVPRRPRGHLAIRSSVILHSGLAASHPQQEFSSGTPGGRAGCSPRAAAAAADCSGGQLATADCPPGTDTLSQSCGLLALVSSSRPTGWALRNAVRSDRLATRSSATESLSSSSRQASSLSSAENAIPGWPARRS
jgi:hypothetical protein